MVKPFSTYFFYCPIAFNFWDEIREVIRLKLGLVFEMNAKTILFGIDFDKSLNCIILLGKYLLYRSKYIFVKPTIEAFISFVKKYYHIQKYGASVTDRLNSFNEEWYKWNVLFA